MARYSALPVLMRAFRFLRGFRGDLVSSCAPCRAARQRELPRRAGGGRWNGSPRSARAIRRSRGAPDLNGNDGLMRAGRLISARKPLERASPRCIGTAGPAVTDLKHVQVPGAVARLVAGRFASGTDAGEDHTSRSVPSHLMHEFPL
jgi:hypothetical protein